MNIINKLTIRHLLLNRNRTLLTIMGIMLSVAMTCATAGFFMSLQGTLRESIIKDRGDYHLGFIGVTKEAAEQIAQDELFDTYYVQDSFLKGFSDIYLRLKSPDRNYERIAEEIGKMYNAQSIKINSELLALDGVIASSTVYNVFFMLTTIIIAIIITGSVIVIANAFNISSSERVRQFGLLKSTGATSSQIMKSVLFEAFVLAAIAIPLGIALGFLIQFVVLYFVNGLLGELNMLNDEQLNFRVIFSWIIIAISIGIAAFTVLISAWFPARRAAKFSPIDAIKRTGDIVIRPKTLKTSKLTQKLFGFEGALAAKSLKRSSGKYRATVISLVVSIVLFVTMSTFIWLMGTTVDGRYSLYEFDVWVGFYNTLQEQDEAEQLLSSLPHTDMKRHLYSLYYTDLPDNIYRNDEDPGMVYIVSLPDSEFEKLAPITENSISGVLLNLSGKKEMFGKTIEYKIHEFTPNIEIPLLDRGFNALGNITVIAEAQELPEIMTWEPPFSLLTIIIPESVYRTRLQEIGQGIESSSVFYINTDNSSEYCKSVRDLAPKDVKYGIIDVAQITRINRNITTIVKLFGYGFIALLSLIAVTSVVSTISTGMALRTQEFAMLYSAGMTPSGMDKMLNLESLLYGFKSLMIGLPLGSLLSYVLYLALKGIAEFPFELPWASMLISCVAIMLLTFGTMRFGKMKMRKINIIDAIRNETL